MRCLLFKTLTPPPAKTALLFVPGGQWLMPHAWFRCFCTAYSPLSLPLQPILPSSQVSRGIWRRAGDGRRGSILPAPNDHALWDGLERGVQRIATQLPHLRRDFAVTGRALQCTLPDICSNVHFICAAGRNPDFTGGLCFVLFLNSAQAWISTDSLSLHALTRVVLLAWHLRSKSIFTPPIATDVTRDLKARIKPNSGLPCRSLGTGR